MTFLTHRRWPLGLLLLAGALVPCLVTNNEYYLRIFIIYGVVFAVVVAGLNVLIGATGQVSLGHVALYAIGAYVSGWLGIAGLPWIVCATVAVAAAVAGGLLIGAPALRLRGAYLALATLAFALIVLELLNVVPGIVNATSPTAALANVPRPTFGSFVPSSSRAYYVFAVAVATPVVWLSRNLFWSATGRQLQAVRDDEPAARALGISIYPAKLGAFVFSAGCAGLAGALYASFEKSLDPSTFSTVVGGIPLDRLSIPFVVALLIGGLGAPVAGPVLGAVATVGLELLGNARFHNDKAFLTALVFLGVLALVPRGLGGLLRRTPLRRFGPGPTLVVAGVLERGGTVADVAKLARSDAGADTAAVSAAISGILSTGQSAGQKRSGDPRSVDDTSDNTSDDTSDNRVSTPMFAPGEAGPDDAAATPGADTPPWGPVVLDAPTILEVDGIAKRYGGVHAVDNVSLAVRQGTIHVLMGPNGSGKSTCLDLITGLVAADAGRVRLANRDLTDLAAHERARAGISRTFQEIRLFGSLTALENCMVGVPTRHGSITQMLRVPGARREDAVHAAAALDLLEAWGLGEFAGRPATDLSYGQRKMLELARAASRRPQILLVDEPAAGLNPRWVGAMVDALAGLRTAGLTLLVVEHHQDVIADLADLVTVLDQGKVIAEGPPDQMQRHPAVLEVYLGNPAPVAS